MWWKDWYVEVDGGDSVRPATSPDDLDSKNRWRFRETVKTSEGPVDVSTVFLGLDHSFGGKGTPILYETMVFGGRMDDYQERYHTRAEALVGHERVKRLVLSQPERRSGKDRRSAAHETH